MAVRWISSIIDDKLAYRQFWVHFCINIYLGTNWRGDLEQCLVMSSTVTGFYPAWLCFGLRNAADKPRR